MLILSILICIVCPSLIFVVAGYYIGGGVGAVCGLLLGAMLGA